jgi:hypothetical protein
MTLWRSWDDLASLCVLLGFCELERALAFMLGGGLAGFRWNGSVGWIRQADFSVAGVMTRREGHADPVDVCQHALNEYPGKRDRKERHHGQQRDLCRPGAGAVW